MSPPFANLRCGWFSFEVFCRSLSRFHFWTFVMETHDASCTSVWACTCQRKRVELVSILIFLRALFLIFSYIWQIYNIKSCFYFWKSVWRIKKEVDVSFPRTVFKTIIFLIFFRAANTGFYIRRAWLCYFTGCFYSY